MVIPNVGMCDIKNDPIGHPESESEKKSDSNSQGCQDSASTQKPSTLTLRNSGCRERKRFRSLIVMVGLTIGQPGQIPGASRFGALHLNIKTTLLYWISCV